MAILFLIISPIAFANEFEFSAYRTKDGTKLLISDVHYASEPVSFAFSIFSEKPFLGELIYEFDGREQTTVKIKFDAGTQFFFPEIDRSVILEKAGVHTFYIEQENSLLEKRTVIVSDPKATPTPVLINQGLPKKTSTRQNRTYQNSTSLTTATVNLPTQRGGGTEVYRKFAASVVLISTEDTFGTGSIITNDGHILTNWHVIQGSDLASIIFKPPGFSSIASSESYLADVIASSKTNDLALLKLRHYSGSQNPISLEASENIEVASDVHAIGHPKGNFWTYTYGVISQIRPNFEWTGDGITNHTADVLQTQTPINPGNSGGPLLNDAGKMVGVNSFTDDGADGLNYAVAITTVKQFLDHAKNHEKENQPQRNSSSQELDENNDGRADTWLIDTDGNGITDTLEVDTDYDGKVDIIFIDNNENGIAEIIIEYLLIAENYIAVVKFDDNEDKIIELIGYDFDLDGELDKIEEG